MMVIVAKFIAAFLGGATSHVVVIGIGLAVRFGQIRGAVDGVTVGAAVGRPNPVQYGDKYGS